MNLADYYSPDPKAPDRFYSTQAAVLRNYSFDRMQYRVAGSTFRSTDMTHWLALDVAARALVDAGFPDGEGLPRLSTGVVLGNTLTGEFSRANLMRLRWPYVRRTVAAALAEDGWGDDDASRFLIGLETRYKEPFPQIDEDTLAGGLANTIAGRICNHFDLAGGGFTVDGACSSSLLSVITASNALVRHDLDVALAGGVDLSIDPFEVIGFAKTGALSTGEMKVYDRGSNGFWPGEGAGVLVLMREQDALDRGARIYASITGWGVSSDGKGGITRPEASGHRLALERAHQLAGYGVETVSYFEGHGTGTALGDETEIIALSGARTDAAPGAESAALGTIKGNFGHTKAAAGVAGLIKAALAVHHQVIPPVTGNQDPHPLLVGDDAAMHLPTEAELWPADQQVRAGVSAMGFGGINSHVTLEQAPGVERHTMIDDRTRGMVGGRQDAELLLLDAADAAGLRERIESLAAFVPQMSQAELADLAGTLAGQLSGAPVRAAVVVTSPEDAALRLTRLLAALDDGESSTFAASDGVFMATATATPPRLAFLFPGQGSGDGAGGALRRRFPVVEEMYRTADLPTGGDQIATEVAQPRIVTGSLAGLRVLHALGIEAETAVGHSLGELSALHWGGALDETQVLTLAAVRGRVMATASSGDGAMASLVVDPGGAEELIGIEELVVAGYNAPEQTVVSGPAEAIDRICASARRIEVTATRLDVSHAFHSPAVAPAAAALVERLGEIAFGRLERSVVSTVTGGLLDAAQDLPSLLHDQVMQPVRFHEAAAMAIERSELLIEVGPGRALTGLIDQIVPGTPALSIDTDSGSLAPLLRAVGAAFTAGVPINTDALFMGRIVRPLSPDDEMTFLESPCETAPASSTGLVTDRDRGADAPPEAVDPDATVTDGASTLDLLREVVADRVELPVEAIDADTHPLDDLHLSSITVGQIVNEVTTALDRAPLEATPNFATVRLGELAETIDDMALEDGTEGAPVTGEIDGIVPWVRSFAVEYVDSPPPAATPASAIGQTEWSVHAPPGHPLTEPLRVGLAGAGIGGGVLLCLPRDCDEAQLWLFLEAAKAAMEATEAIRFVVVQQGLGAAALARTLHLEHPAGIRTTVVDLADIAPAGPEAVEAAVTLVVAEVAATTDFVEVRYDDAGHRTVPALRVLPVGLPDPEPQQLGPDDVLLVTGGGKGITAECALALATASGVKLALLGRSDPAEDDELAGNLARMDAADVRYRYRRADVTSVEEVAQAVAAAEAELGSVTAIMHGAGTNSPRSLIALTEDEFRATVAPKVGGLRAVLAAVDPQKVTLLVTFGSIIGRAGLRGEAHYATANDWMTELTVRFGRENPHARVLALEWSVWSGAGMGEKLGIVDALKRDGITPIPMKIGIEILMHALADPSSPPVQVVCGRTGGLATLAMERRDVPLTRFVDRIVVHYPGIELITEADLSAGSDPYLDDHRLEDGMLFPAVIGMEAMTQVASALTGDTGVPMLQNVEFRRPIIVPPTGSTTVRVIAQAQEAGIVDVVVRSSETGFSADHFRAQLRFPRPALPEVPGPPVTELARVLVDPLTELYGGVLFQGKRFQRLNCYRRVSARHAVAEIGTVAGVDWFAPFLPQQLTLADPGTRDAMMHAIQCCVPDAILLPQRIDRLYLAEKAAQEADFMVLDARERSQDGDTYRYDVDVRDPDGVLVERWEGLALRAVHKRDGAGPWVPTMLGPHLERSAERVLGGRRAVVVEPDPPDTPMETVAQRLAQTELAASRAVDRKLRLSYRPDGKPEADDVDVSASHAAGLTLVVAGEGPLGCDMEVVVDRTAEEWAGLLDPDLVAVRDLLIGESGEQAAVANTRIWSTLECLRKTGSVTQALTLQSVHPDGWTVLSAGDTHIATWVTTVNEGAPQIVFALSRRQESG